MPRPWVSTKVDGFQRLCTRGAGSGPLGGESRRRRLRQIRGQLDLSGPAPAWATGNHKQGVVKPNAKLFGEFAAVAARHFDGRVDRYSVWNEPNYVGWLAPRHSEPSLYRALYSH